MKDNLETGRSGKKRAIGVGTGVLAGLIAGGSAMLLGPAHGSAAPATNVPVVQAAAAAPSAAPVVQKPLATAAVEDPDQAARDAFFAAGYTYDDAVALAKAWHNADAFAVKAVAGRKLEAGETLPIKPGSSAPSAEEVTATKDDAAVTRFFDAGYTYDDAVKLAKLWGSADPYHAKIAAGQKLLAGETISLKPSGGAASSDSTAADAFYAAGYTYDDAVALAKTWHSADAYAAKVAGGKKLEANETLPIAPGSSAPSADEVAATKDEAAVTKFFDAGYTYDDAVKLAKLWGSADPYHAKIAAGKKLEAGLALPVAR